MPLVPLKLPAGFYRNGTDYEGSNRWRDGSLVRWLDGSMRPVGGWEARKNGFTKNPVRGMHAWQDNNGTAWLAGGSFDELVVMTGAGIAYDITPDDLAGGRESAAVNTGYGFQYYGQDYYGNPRPVNSDIIPQEASTWQLDNFGQNLIALHQDDGRLFEWPLSTTTGAELITNGSFATDANWNKGGSCTIANGYASYGQTKAVFSADNTVVSTVNYTVTVANVSGYNKFVLNGVAAPALTLVQGTTVVFDVSDGTNSGHPFRFKDAGGNTFAVTASGTEGTSGATVTLVVPTSGTMPASYYCTVHGAGMGASVTTTANTVNIDYATETITATAHGFTNGDQVTYTVPAGQTAIGGLVSGTNYFVVSAATNSLKLSATSGGAAINLTPPPSVTINGSSPSVVVLASNKIVISNTFTNGDKVAYSNGNGTDITGLVNNTEYFIVNASSSEFQLAATSGGTPIVLTAVGAGTAHSFTKRLGSLHEIAQINTSGGIIIDQTVSGLVATPDTQDSHDLVITLIDRNDDNDATTTPSVNVKVTGTTSNTVLVNELLNVGSNEIRFGSDDTAVKLEIIPNAYNTPNFDIDNVSLRKKTVIAPIANAPIDNKGMVVTEERFIFALGAGGNSRKVQWCDKENNTQWAPAATNEAGDIELATAGQIMQGIRSRGVTLILTDTDAHVAQYIAPPYVYSFQRIGTHCGAVSRLSAVAVDRGVFWYGQENFHYFDGNTVRTLKCDVHDYVFGDFNKDQQSKVWGMSVGTEDEIWWFYCSSQSTEIDRYVAYDAAEGHWLIGNLSRTAGVSRGVFAHPFMAGELAETININVKVVATNAGNRYAFNTFLGNAPVIELVKGKTYYFSQADATNANHPLRFSTQPNGIHANGVEYTEGVTTGGVAGQAGSYTQIVVGANAPTLYYFCTNHANMGNTANTVEPVSIFQHEIGHNYDSQPIFCETSAISIGNGDQVAKVTEVIPDEKTQGDVDLKFKTRFHPNGAETTHGAFNPSNPTSVRFTGRQIRMRVEGDQNVDWRVGTMRLEVKAGGRR